MVRAKRHSVVAGLLLAHRLSVVRSNRLIPLERILIRPTYGATRLGFNARPVPAAARATAAHALVLNIVGPEDLCNKNSA